jgi:L-ascorbate metabolism protein UlaG (beta-lactamase superfamily)
MFLKVFGKNPSGKHLDKMKRSINYKINGFENISDTPVMSKDTSTWEILKKYFRKNPDLKPSSPLPFVRVDLKEINSIIPVIVWFGHSSYFIRIQNKNILVDPVFSSYASPLSFMIKAFKGTNVYTTDDMPEIDFLILTHDHYDHMDYSTIKKLKGKVKNIYCSLGLASHLIYWGFDEKNITEMDWWQTNILDENVTLTAAPARHFSGRGIRRYKTLWSSFILNTTSHNIYLGGDSGYDTHFKSIGEKFGPFDIAILENGQYNLAWPFIHMMPEETVQAAIDLKAKVLLPVHWAKFPLSLHTWNDPIIRLLKAAAVKRLKVTTPMIGEPVILNEVYPDKEWWNF